MKKLSLVIISVLVIVLISFQQKYKLLQKEFLLARDSLSQIKTEKYYGRRISINPEIDKMLKEGYLHINDSIKEVHRINANYGQRLYLLRFELLKDSSILMTIKKYSARHPLTGQGEDTLYYVNTRKLDYSIIQTFRGKLTIIEFLKAIPNNHTFCCFGGGDISLESILSSGERIRFSTFCRESIQFAEACEYLMRQANDEELNRILGAQDKVIKEANKK